VVDATAPTILTCASSKTVYAGANCQAAVPDLTGEIVASDNCSASLSITQSPAPGTLVEPGNTEVALTVKDASGNSRICKATVTVVDATAPTIVTGASGKTLYAGANCQAVLPDLTSEIVASDNCSTSLSITQSPIAGTIIGPGSTVVTILVKDASGNSATCTATVMVTDTTAPEISPDASANPSTLWPPNHKMVPVTLNYSATDECDSSPACTLSVTANEGGPADWQILDAHHVLLRAEREGGGGGRVYSIKITCRDKNNNSSSRIVTVIVPHDQR